MVLINTEILVGEVSPTVSLVAYAAGDLLGTGGQGSKLVYANLMPDQPFISGKITKLELLDTDDLGADIDVMFFANRTFTSTLTDNAALALNDADAAFYRGQASIVGADYVDLGGAKVATKAGLSIPFNLLARKPLKVLFVAKSIVTYVAAGALTLRVYAEPAP